MVAPESAQTLSDCPLCQRAAVVTRTTSVEYAIECTHCGGFEMTDTARVLLQTLPPRFLIALSRATQAGGSTPVAITMQSVARLVSPYL